MDKLSMSSLVARLDDLKKKRQLAIVLADGSDDDYDRGNNDAYVSALTDEIAFLEMFSQAWWATFQSRLIILRATVDDCEERLERPGDDYVMGQDVGRLESSQNEIEFLHGILL